MATAEPALRVRINQIDYTVAPAGELDNSNLHRVPVIRIYGDSSLGKKTCVHVHQVYPYFLAEYQGKMNPDNVNRYIARLTQSLNHAIAISMKRNPHSPKSQFVRAIILVKGVHFYGFHAGYSPFLKVHIADPAFVNRAVTILQSGTVMKTRFRVYESHLSYLLQFLCDFGLYGCGWIDLSEVWERGGQISDSVDEGGNASNEEQAKKFLPSPYFRQSRMPLEVDVPAHQILNRQMLIARNLHHKLIIPAPPSPDEPLVPSVRELWDDERRRRIAQGLTPSPELPKDLSENSRGHGGEWVAEARWWDEIRKRIERERDKEKAPDSGMAWEKWVMTTFESIEALWEREYRTWRPNKGDQIAVTSEPVKEEENPYDSSRSSGMNGHSSADEADAGEADVDVDEALLSSQAMNEYMEAEEAEWAKLLGGQREQEDEAQDADDLVDDGAPPEDPANGEQDGSSSSGSCSTTPRSDSAVLLSPRKRLNPFNTPCSPHTPKRQRVDEFVRTQTPESPTARRSRLPDGGVPDDVDQDRTPTQLPTIKGAYNDAASNIPDTAVSCALNLVKLPKQTSIEASEKEQNVVQMISGHDGSGLPSSAQSSEKKTLSQLPSFIPLTLADSARPNNNSYSYAIPPPTTAELLESHDKYNLPSKIYRNPYYSIEGDAPERPREYAGLVFHLKAGDGLHVLEEWVHEPSIPTLSETTALQTELPRSKDVTGWEYASSPPSAKQARQWLLTQKAASAEETRRRQPSQIQGPTQMNPFGIKITPTKPSDINVRERRNMTVFALEVFAPSRGDRLPDPGEDEITAVFYSFQDADVDAVDESFSSQSGILVVDHPHLKPDRLRDFHVEAARSELDLLNTLIDVICETNPDILVGWEVQAASWGYLSTRACTYDMDFSDQISRASGRTLGSGGSESWGLKTTSTFKVTGRHVLNLWRIIRAEQSFTSYTFENAVFQLLRRRTPKYSSRTLTEWFTSDIAYHTANLLRYYAGRTAMVLELLDAAQVVTKTAEFARVFGVDFFSVLSRGSQFKVESFMFRIAKPESFVLLSPSKQDVGKQNAAECMPLIMEPLSAFYNSPLVVLDFQSLYPSIMIAYNYCYSTCLGRVTDFKGQYKFGVTEVRQPAGILETLQDHINVAPNGMMYVKQDVRRGLLGRMLTELLDTRVMVKQAMKRVKDDKALTRVLNARQLGLKFIANVTYGYTSATYSGRMPAVEIADSIVQSGRETLEKAVRVIDSTKKWGAKVVYGDTDSLFIYLRGKTKEQAFRIGHEMADTITAMNPAPVKLKFEKVYLPCVLMAKKRYVGFKYEHPDEKEPGFDAKGIETVRRDGVPAQAKMTETCLKILFRTQDLSKVKEYCCTSWGRILENRVSIQDFIFSKEVKLGTYSDKVPPPAGATVAARKMLQDPNTEPQYGDRIPYVIVRGAPGSRLVDRAVAPEELLESSQKNIDAAYYISRVLIPPLERVFNLVGADVRSWYDEMPKTLRADQADALLNSPRKNKAAQAAVAPNAAKIDGLFYTTQCLHCGAPALEGICELCLADPQTTICGLSARIRRTETRLRNAHMACSSCAGHAYAEPVKCESLDCPWLYERKKAEGKAEALGAVQDLIDELELGAMGDDSPDAADRGRAVPGTPQRDA